MAKVVNVNFKLDADVKKNMEEVCSEMGISMSAAFSIFAKKVGRERRIPFELVGELPEEKAFQMFMDGVNGFSDDFMEDGRVNEISAERETLCPHGEDEPPFCGRR